MARRPVALGATVIAGAAAAALVLALTVGTLAAVALRAEFSRGLGPAEWAAIRFTLWQATLSALLSTVLAVPVARALARRHFPGRALLVTLLGAPFILPVIVAVLGIVAVFGRGGWVNAALSAVGLGPVSIYGLPGVLLAHVFFNLPLATRLVLQGWLGIPAERFRLAAALGFGPADIARHIERPMLRAVLPGAFAVIFLICMTSFAVVLALGGGPRATTIELAIYQAFRFDFDLGKAALLATIQFALCVAAAGAARFVTVPEAAGPGLDRPRELYLHGRLRAAADALWITLSAVFLLAPLAAVVLRGAPAIAALPHPVWAAAGRSVVVSVPSAFLSVGLGLAMAAAIARLGRRRGAAVLEGIGYLSVAASPLVIGTGLFILIFPIADPARLALAVTAVVNAVMSLPFVLRALVPELRRIEADHGRLADSLGMHGWARYRLLILPRARRALGFGLGLAAALSMGDLGVIALFADPEGATLPLQIYRLMASYRMADAAGAALLLLALSLSAFWLFDRGGRLGADA